MSEQESGVRIVSGHTSHWSFVKKLSGEVFSHFGNYEGMLPPMLSLPWVRIVVAEAGGVAIGFAMYSVEDQAEPEAEIDLVAIAVAPDWQARGVGRRLLQRVESDACALFPSGTPSVRLTVAEDNGRACRMFRRAGYVTIPGDTGSYDGGQRSMGLRKSLR